MLGIWAFTWSLSLQTFHLLFLATLATSLPPLALPINGPSALPPRTQKDPNLVLVNPVSSSTASLTLPHDGVFVYFHNEGPAIPLGELFATLAATTFAVRAYLPDSAAYPIPTVFEKNVSFPETTGDSVSVTIHSPIPWLSWLELSDALIIVEEYMLGISGPGHPTTHSHALDFYIQLRGVGGAWIDVAQGVVKFVAGHKAVGKRSLLILPTLHVTNLDSSSPPLSVLTLPIIYNVATNLDLYITSLGIDIPPDTIVRTIEAAYSDIILTHEDIDSPIDEPYSFNKSFGPMTQPVNAKIEISAYRGKEVTWGLLYLLLYGLKRFMQETDQYNALEFEIEDTKLGRLGKGEVEFRPGVGLAR